ncbi:MAG TPA: branched-chain amino acid ABC transporter substrate-binding protein [Solirubrobacteraceae bacterium]
MAIAPLLAGCGGTSESQAQTTIGSHLTIYSSLPLTGPAGEEGQQVLDGERLALADAHGDVGRFSVSLESLDDANPEGGEEEWSRGETAANASAAAKNETTIAYIGDFDSYATAISLQTTNQAGILQVSPRSPYVGLTSSFDAGQGDPERLYPTGKRNFVRLLPGDIVEGAAEVQLMRSLGLHTVYILSDGEPFEMPLASIVADDATAAGMEVVGEAVVEVAHANAESSFEAQVEAVGESGAEAIFYSGQAGEGVESLWRQLHAAYPAMPLLGSDELAEPLFAAGIGPAGGMTYVTTPVLPPQRYPAPAKRVLDEFRSRYHFAPSSYVLCGYEAMSVVLAAIERAGIEGNDREAVVKAMFETRRRESVLGRYSVLSDGETTLASYGVDRIERGQLRFWRELRVGTSATPDEHVP